MKLYSNLPSSVISKLATSTDIPVTYNMEEADIFILMYNDEPPEITVPDNTIIVGQMDDEGVMQYADSAVEKGVDDNNVLLVQPGQKISYTAIKNCILKLKDKILTNQLIESESEKKTGHKASVIAVCGFKGGVGRTVLATGLTYHYSNCGEKVALIDLGNPSLSLFYMGKPPLAEKKGWQYAKTVRGDIYIPKIDINENSLLEFLDDLQDKYDRIVIDLPTGLPDALTGVLEKAVRILMIDYDLRTLEVTKDQLEESEIKEYILVANRIPRVYTGTYGAVVVDVLGVRPHIEIQADANGCQAVLEKYSPVNDDNGSEIIAAKIGELASLISKGEVANA